MQLRIIEFIPIIFFYFLYLIIFNQFKKDFYFMENLKLVKVWEIYLN